MEQGGCFRKEGRCQGLDARLRLDVMLTGVEGWAGTDVSACPLVQLSWGPRCGWQEGRSDGRVSPAGWQLVSEGD